MSKSVVFLQGKKIVLRPVNEKTDLDDFHSWINDPEVRVFLNSNQPISWQQEKEWFEDISKRDKSIILAIVAEDKLIGSIGLHAIDHINSTATLGIVIGNKDYWGKGYGFDAEMTFLNYIFNNLGIRKVCASVFTFNKRSHCCAAKCGFKEEGVRRKQILRDGEYQDEILLAAFKEDWEESWKKYQS